MKNIHTTRRVCCFMEIWKERESERIARIAMDYDHDGYGNANNRPLSCLCMQQIPKPIHEFHVAHMPHYVLMVHVNMFNWKKKNYNSKAFRRERPRDSIRNPNSNESERDEMK